MSNERELLRKYGLKDALIDKLSNLQIKEIVAFAMDHIQSSNLLNMLLQLASMEAGDKQGAAYLAHEGIAVPMQLKNLSKEQIDEITSDYHIHQDIALAIKSVKEKIIENQQDKFAMHGVRTDTEQNFNEIEKQLNNRI